MRDIGAAMSAHRVYRWALWRIWDHDLPHVMFICLNPSTADETRDDPTLRRCRRFAADWGFGGLYMTNLFALRATDPVVMKAHDKPIGRENDRWLVHEARRAGIVVAAWGAHGSHKGRDMEVADMIRREAGRGMSCMGYTRAGDPRHPLMMPANTSLIEYNR